MPQICPRCTKILPGDPEDGSIHTCTPTDYARKLEARVAELEAMPKRILELQGAYWNATKDCCLGCCFEPRLEEAAEAAKKLIH